MVAVEDLDEPLRDAARELGVEDLTARLTDPRVQRQMDHSHDFICDNPECKAGITVTDRYGEVGHRVDCPRRQRKYAGERHVNDIDASKKNQQSILRDYDRKVAPDGGVGN